MLNLAGNDIAHVNSLIGMDSLTELNLRRNKIMTVVSCKMYNFRRDGVVLSSTFGYEPFWETTCHMSTNLTGMDSLAELNLMRRN